MRSTTTESAEETFELAYSFSESLTERTLLLLEGDLGAGKTVFAKGIAAGLDIDPALVTSPTFTLINEYSGRLKFIHIDLYRLATNEENAHALGLDELLGERAVTVIEWPERLGSYRLPAHYRVRLEIVSDQSRKVTIEDEEPNI